MANRETEKHEGSVSSAVDKSTPLAKLSLPRLAEGVARPRLFEFLDESRRAAATWIAAPGGAGKTTLAATYLLERELPYLWYQLDQDDADPATFFYYLGLAAKQAVPDQEIFLPLLTPEYLPDIPGFARRFFRQLYTLLPVNTVLVLDNYQDLGDSPVFAEILRSALAEIPEQGHLFSISRSDPPSVLARHRTIGTLAFLDWETLRLTLEETEAIVGQDQPLDSETLQRLYQRADGWPAGVTLLLEQIKRKGTDSWAQGATSLETVFDFFANEFFDELPESLRDFLLQTALLAHMTPSLAEQVSNNPEAGHILTDLHRRHFFTNRRDLGEISYQYHALFREFLLTKLKDIYTQERYLALTRNTGKLLSQYGRQEEAVTLHFQAQDWETAIPLLLEQAPQLMAQGRTQIIAGWIQQIPDELVEGAPWLLYWKGMSQQFIEPFVARATLERAYEGFAAEDDVLGQMLAISALIEVAYLVRQNVTAFSAWIEKVQKHLDSNPEFPNPAVEVRILTSLISTLPFAQPNNSRLPQYAERVFQLLDSNISVNQRIFVAGHLIFYGSLVAGDLELCGRIMRENMPLLQAQELTAINQIFFRQMCAYPLLLRGELEAAFDINKINIDLIKQNDLRFMEFIECTVEMYILCNLGKINIASELIERMEQLLNSAQPLDVVWLSFAKFIHSIAIEDKEGCFHYGLAAIKGFNEDGLILIVMATSCLLAMCCCDIGRDEQVHEYLKVLKENDCGGSAFLHHQVLLIESYISLLRGDAVASHEYFREAIAVADKRPFFGCFYLWYPRKMMARLSVMALRSGIEEDFIRDTIRQRKLLPGGDAPENWPWQVKIYTLGQFRVEMDGNDLEKAKGQSKPLGLLQALIALGGADVKIDRIAEILWPDADGDAAVSAFTTTLSRLRKLLGEETIIVKGGRASLDERRCWLDVRALERYLDELKFANADSKEIQGYVEKLLDLYRGPFLGDEDAEWVWRQRDRSRETFAQHLSRLLASLRAAEASDSITYALERLEDIDPAAARRCRELTKI